MRVYIASKYLDHKDFNQEIYDTLIAEKVEAFLPKSINVDAITFDEMTYVAETCYEEIDKCDVILIVTPFGKSVSSEIGYAIALKRKGEHKILILFNSKTQEDSILKKEAMIEPYIDVEVHEISELLAYINAKQNKFI